MQYNSHDDKPPYEDYLEFSKVWLTRCFNWLKPSGRMCLNVPLDKNKGGQQSVGADFTTLAKQIGYQYHSTIIWNEGKKMSIRLYELAKQQNDKETMDFCADVLETFERHNSNGHIEWER